MNGKGVSYDVGRVMGLNWRPVFDPAVVHRELEIIRDDLHCNAVRITSGSTSWTTAAEAVGPASVDLGGSPAPIAYQRHVLAVLGDVLPGGLSRCRG